MRIVNTHETAIQAYRYGAWVEFCPGNEAAFRPMRIIPSYPNITNYEIQQTQNPQTVPQSAAA